MMTSTSWGEKATTQCWECRKRRLVCDLTLPKCRKCRRAGRECPGYSEQKPLQWVEPGKIVSGRRKKETKTKLPICLTKDQDEESPEQERGIIVWEAEDSGSVGSETWNVHEPDCEATHDDIADADPPFTRERQITRRSKTTKTNNRMTRRRTGSKSIVDPLLHAIAGSIPHPGLNQRDVNLIRLYASRTSLTLAGPRSQNIWCSYAFDHAKGHKFLMHGLLALSALHGSAMPLKDDHDFVNLAWRHHESAVSSFRCDVTTIQASNSQPVAIFSILMGIFSFGVPSICGFPEGASPVSMFINIIGVWRKAMAALGPELAELKQGPLKSILNPDVVGTPHPIAQDSKILLKELETYIERCDESQENKEAYLDAMFLLVSYFWRLPHFSPFTDLMGWPMNVSDRFYELLVEKRPMPLFLLAYMMITFFHTPNVWVSPWSKHIIQEIWNTLDPPLRHFIEWPARYVGIVPRQEHPDACRCFDCYMLGKDPELRWTQNATPLIPARLND